MGLESTTTIAGLNALWPLGTDPKSQGDDHLRLTKAVLQADAFSLSANNTATGALQKFASASSTQTIVQLIGPASGGANVNSGLLGFYDGATPATRRGYVYYNGASTRMELGADGTGALTFTAGTTINISPNGTPQAWTFDTGGRLFNYAVTNTARFKFLYAGGGTEFGMAMATGAATGTAVSFLTNASTGVGSISCTGTATAYNTSSDERLKTFTGPLTGDEAAAIIRADPVRHFTWNIDDSEAVGWSAQHSYSVSEDLATPPMIDPTREVQPQPGEEGFQPWGMDQAKRTPYLWAALAWALDRIDQLESRIAALEA